MNFLTNTNPSSLTSSTTILLLPPSVCKAPNSANASTREQSASSVVPAPAPAHRFGAIATGSAPPLSSMPTASSSTAVTREPPNASPSWDAQMASGAAAPSSTAPMPAPAVSTSPTLSNKSNVPSPTATPNSRSDLSLVSVGAGAVGMRCGDPCGRPHPFFPGDLNRKSILVKVWRLSKYRRLHVNDNRNMAAQGNHHQRHSHALRNPGQRPPRRTPTWLP